LVVHGDLDAVEVNRREIVTREPARKDALADPSLLTQHEEA